SIQAMTKVLCALHNVFIFLFCFLVTFDAYLSILRNVQSLVNRAIGRDSPVWRMLHSCPTCNYKNEQPLFPACLDAIYGNNSLKRIDGSGHADERVFASSYLIPPAETSSDVNQNQITSDLSPADIVDSMCTENWKAANTISENTVSVFNQTGVFISACRHGIIQTMVEISNVRVNSAKYAIATMDKVLDVYGPNSATGYDIGCSFSTTIAASSIAKKASDHKHRFVVNSFHGHAHNRACQLDYHPLYQPGFGIEDLETCERIFAGSNAVAPVVRHASYFHWLQFIDLQFNQWDQDHYLELSKFLYNNYKQAIDIIENLAPVVNELKTALGITDADFVQWNTKEREYLRRLSKAQMKDVQGAEYVEVLEDLQRAE
ncbi:hypothetical protein HYDPIDRAFT_99045, partial [Hydnomerulius pinastri MD-312]